jgi:hypothetical protein
LEGIVNEQEKRRTAMERRQRQEWRLMMQIEESTEGSESAQNGEGSEEAEGQVGKECAKAVGRHEMGRGGPEGSCW